MSDHMQTETYTGLYLAIDGTDGIVYLPADIIGLPSEDDLPVGATVDEGEAFDRLQAECEDFYMGGIQDISLRNGTLYRLSAPGYLDATEWSTEYPDNDLEG